MPVRLDVGPRLGGLRPRRSVRRLRRSRPWMGLAAAALASCGGTDLPQQDTAIVLRAVLATLAACTQPLDADGNISEPALAAAGWTPESRRVGAIVTRGNSTGMEERAVPPRQPVQLRTSGETEYSEWIHSGWQGALYLSRHGGAISERTMGQCAASYRGSDARTADQALAAMTRRLGSPAGRGERARGGDWLTPRWDPAVHEVYWRLPFHDVYWTSSNPREVTVEVRAMPDRDQLDRWSPDRPPEQYRIRESGS